VGKDLTRVISALVMILVVALLIYLGSATSFWMIFLVGVVVFDELLVNFIRIDRKSIKYISSLFLYLVPMILIFFKFQEFFTNNLLIQICLLMNIALLAYLFLCERIDFKITSALESFPFIVSIYIFLNTFSLSYLFFSESWWKLVSVLLFITYGMDTGAWFFGKNFGRHKLWPAISPNKTIEGLIGGMLTSGILGGAVFHVSFQEFYISQFFVFCMLGAISQLGDLLQSRIKRESGIKDSSNLIPGHGGLYDRVDSLFFLTPFYLVLVQYYLS